MMNVINHDRDSYQHSKIWYTLALSVIMFWPYLYLSHNVVDFLCHLKEHLHHIIFFLVFLPTHNSLRHDAESFPGYSKEILRSYSALSSGYGEYTRELL